MILALSHCTVDLDARVVLRSDGQRLGLTPIEARLLAFLDRCDGAPVPRATLLEEVWGYAPTVVSRAVDATVKRVRIKIERDPKEPEHLLTEWGAGYRLVGCRREGQHLDAPPSEPVLVCALVPAAAMIQADAPAVWLEARAVYLELATRALEPQGGFLVRVDGDEVLTAFASARQAQAWTLAVQRRLREAPWSERALAHPELAEVRGDDGELSWRGVRVAMAITSDGVEAAVHPVTGAPEVRGPGVRRVRDRAARTPAGSVHLAGATDRIAPTGLVGRDAELAQVVGALESHAIVTLHGTGGIGKTSLSLQVPQVYPVSSWAFCALEACHDAPAVTSVVAEALGISQDVPALAAAVSRIGAALALRPSMLLILDNAEQVADPLGPLVIEWRRMAPACRILVTSRRPLELPGEACVEVGPLGADAGAALLREQVAAARGRPCEDGDDEALEAIVAATSAIPLALELAAARARVLALPDIAARLHDSGRLLARARSAGARHDSMEAALQWSWEQLTPHAQQTLAALSVFVGPFTPDAVEAIVVLSPDAPWVLDVLDDLVFHSLVHVARGTERRLALLAPIRHFVTTKGAPDEPSQARFVAWFSRRADPASIDAVDGPDERSRRAQLRAEVPDLWKAMDLALTLGDDVGAARCWLAASLHHRRSAPPGPAVARYERLRIDALDEPELAARCTLALGELVRLGTPEASLPILADARQRAREPRTLARIAVAEGTARMQTGELAGTEGVLQDALRASREAGDEVTRARALVLLGGHHTLRGRPTDAAEVLREALQIARRSGGNSLQSRVLCGLGSALHAAGELDAAWETYAEAHRVTPDPMALARLQIGRGNLAGALHDNEAAVACFEDALRLFRALGDGLHEGMTLLNLANVFLAVGDIDACDAPLQRALVLEREARNPVSEAYARLNLSRTRVLQDRPAEAITEAARAVDLLRATSDVRAQASALVILADALFASGDPRGCLAQVDAGLALLEQRDIPGLLGRFWLARAQVDGDADALQQAQGFLTRAQDSEGLGLLACLRWHDGGSGEDLAEAESIARRLGCGPRSRLGRALSATR